jgi:iojap-like protein
MKEILKRIVNIIEDKKGEQTVVLDISEISSLADYFVISSANNINQLQAISDDLQELLEKEGLKINKVEGAKNSSWVLLDFTDIVIHLFTKEDRIFYNLERIWADAIQVEL